MFIQSVRALKGHPRYLQTHTYYQNFYYLSYITLDRKKKMVNCITRNFTQSNIPVPCLRVSSVLHCIRQRGPR